MKRDGTKLTRAQQKALRSQQILDAAFEEFSLNGFVGTRLEDIASRSGVSKGTVYLYFETKEVLFEAMIKCFSEPFEEIAQEANSSFSSPLERLASLLHRLYERLYDDRRRREIQRLVISEGRQFPHVVERYEREVLLPIVNRVEGLLAEGVGIGQFRHGPAQFADLIVAPIVTAPVVRMMSGDRKKVDKDRYIQAYIDLLTKGLEL